MRYLARDGKQFDTHFEAEVWEHELDRRDQKNDANFDSVVAILKNAGFPTSAKRLAAFKHRVKLGPKGVRMQGYDGATMSILDSEMQQPRVNPCAEKPTRPGYVEHTAGGYTFWLSLPDQTPRSMPRIYDPTQSVARRMAYEDKLNRIRLDQARYVEYSRQRAAETWARWYD